MSYISNAGEQSTSSELLTLTNLTDLTSSGVGEFLRKTGQYTFENASLTSLGYVIGPATNSDNYIPQWDGVNSSTLQNGLAVPAGGLAGLTSPTFATSITGSYLTVSEILITDGSKNIVSAPVATYPSLTELSYIKGLSSAIQTQLNSKAATLSGTINEIAYFNSASTITSLTVSTYPSLTELSYIKGLTSAIQTQLNSKQATLTNPVTGTGTINELAYWTSGSAIGTLAVATYPSLTELSYVKGLSSAVQTQLNAKLTSANIEDSIVDGHTTIAPSGNAVFDALALKAPLAAPTFTGLVTLPTGIANVLFNAPEGTMINGKISPSVSTITATKDQDLGSTANDAGFETNYWRAQAFTPGVGVTTLSKVILSLKKTGSPTGNLTVEIQTDNAGVPSGTVLSTITLDVATLTTSYVATTFTLPTVIAVTAGTKYHCCLKGQAAWSAGTDVVWGFASGSGLPQYNFGAGNFSSNATTVSHDLETYYNTGGTLTVALKTLAGTDPSATDPVYVMIGGVVRVITYAVSTTYNAGYSYANAGSAELATKEIDWATLLSWNTNKSGGAGVDIAFSRYFSGNLYSDFNGTDTNEKAYLGNSPRPAAGDVVVNIGRFAATLSAGAGYTWTVPTFTASNLIQRPIYETRWLTWVPTVSYQTGSITTQVNGGVYKMSANKVEYYWEIYITGIGTMADQLFFTTPMTPVNRNFTGVNQDHIPCSVYNNGAYFTGGGIDPANNRFFLLPSTWGNNQISLGGFYEI